MAEMLDYHYGGSQRDSKLRQLRSLFLKLGPRKTGGLFLTLLVMLVLPITLLAVQQRQEFRQRASETECEQTVLSPEGMAGRDPSTNQFYTPSVAVMGSKIYVFLIGEGGAYTGKPIGDWYNLYVIDGVVNGDGGISWTDHGGTIFRNMGGILSSTVKIFVDGQGIHIYVQGFNVETQTPQGQYLSIIEQNDTIIPWTDQLDGNEGRAQQSPEAFVNGKQYRFSTSNGPVTGCRVGHDNRPIAGRDSVADRPDEQSGNQFKVLYVIPSDGTDRNLDRNGVIERSIKEQQKWLAAKSNGQQIRFDTFENGKLDIGFVKLGISRNDVIGYETNDYPFAHYRIAEQLKQVGFNLMQKPNKRYAVYYDGDTQYACGDAYSPPDGIAGIIYLEGHNLSDKQLCSGLFPLNGLPGVQKSAETILLHEMFHTLGAVSEKAPHYGGGHISIPDGRENEYDISKDLMYSGPRRLNPASIDAHNDDYFNVAGESISDVLKTGFFYRLNDYIQCTPFYDICDYSSETQKAIACLSEKYGVVKGYTSGTFGGEDTILRGTYVAFLVRYRVNVMQDQEWVNDYNSIESYYDGLPAANSSAPFGQKKFSDVDKANPLWKEIYLSQKKGFILGYTDGEFKPYEKWFYGFHGITRDDNFRGDPYKFTSTPNDEDQRGISRASFITKLYQYSQDRYADKIQSCTN